MGNWIAAEELKFNDYNMETLFFTKLYTHTTATHFTFLNSNPENSSGQLMH